MLIEGAIIGGYYSIIYHLIELYSDKTIQNLILKTATRYNCHVVLEYCYRQIILGWKYSNYHDSKAINRNDVTIFANPWKTIMISDLPKIINHASYLFLVRHFLQSRDLGNNFVPYHMLFNLLVNNHNNECIYNNMKFIYQFIKRYSASIYVAYGSSEADILETQKSILLKVFDFHLSHSMRTTYFLHRIFRVLFGSIRIRNFDEKKRLFKFLYDIFLYGELDDERRLKKIKLLYKIYRKYLLRKERSILNFRTYNNYFVKVGRL
jgi:hypothetical protein